MELKSLTQQSECARAESECLRILSECLGDSSMRLGVPFIAPRQLGAVGGQLGRPNLPSVGWRTGQSGAPLDNHCSYPVRDLLPFLAHPTVGPRGQLAHRTLSGAYRTVRCAQPTVAAGHASPADCATDRCAGDRWLTGQSGDFSSYATVDSREQHFSLETSLAHWTLSGAPPNTVRCTTRQFGAPDQSCCLAAHSQVFSNLFLFFSAMFLTLRQIH
jgi:hypothetical protein